MKRFILITAIVLAVILAVLCGAFILLIKSNGVHQYVISKVNENIHGSITFQRLRIAPLKMQFEIQKLSLLDPEGDELAGFDRFFIDVAPLPLIGRKVVVKKAELEYPRANIESDSDGNLSLLKAFPKGESKASETSSSSSPTIFPVELRGLDITGGKIHFASQKDSLRIEALGFTFSAKGETESFSADLNLRCDYLTIGHHAANIPLSDLHLMARIADMEIDSLDLKFTAGESVFALNGRASSLTDDPLIDLAITSNIALDEIRSFLALEEQISGHAGIRLTASGNVSNPDLELSFGYDGGAILGYPVDRIELKTNLADRNLRLSPAKIITDRGSIDINGTVDVRAVFANGFLEEMGSINNIKYDLTIAGKDLPIQYFTPDLSGTAALSLGIKGQGADPDSIDAYSEISATIAELKLNPEYSALDAVLSCSANLRRGNVHVTELSGLLGDAQLSLSGGYHITSQRMNVDLSLSVPSLARLFSFAGFEDSVTGSAAIATTVTGDLKRPQVAVTLWADSLAMQDMQVDSVRLSAGLDSKGTVRVNSLALNRLNSGLEAYGSVQVMRNGTLHSVDEIEFDLSLQSKDLHIDNFVDTISGKVEISANVFGTVKSPQGYARLSVSALSAAGYEIDGIDLSVRFDDERANIESLLIAIMPGQEITAAGWVALTDSFAVTISAPNLDLPSLATFAGADLDSLYGTLCLNLRAMGSIDQPEVDGKLNISGMQFGDLPLDDIALNLGFKDQQAQIYGTAVGAVASTFDIDTKDFTVALTLTEQLLDPYLAMLGQDLNGTITTSLSARGNADSISATTGSVHIQNLTIGHDDIQLVRTDDLKVLLDKNRYTVADFTVLLAGVESLKGRAQGHIEGPHDIILTGSFPLSTAAYFTEDVEDIDGTIDLDLAITGMADAPDLKGDIRLRNISMTLPGLSQRLHSINGRIIASRSAVQLESLRGNLDDGSFVVRGEAKLDNFTPSDMRADIVLRMLPIGVPEMLDIVVDARLNIAGNPDTTSVSGNIVLLDGVYYQDIVINPLSNIGQRRRKETYTPEQTETPYLKNMLLNVGVQARSPFRVNNNMAMLTIDPDLQLMGTLQSPALNGRANVERGTIAYLRNEFEVKRGVIDFVNPYGIEPRVDIFGVVPVKERTVQLEISGTLDDLVFKLGSDDPSLEDQDILSLLVLGKTIGELQSNFLPGAGGSGGQSNQQMLASLIASTIGDDLRRAAGLDILEVETGDLSGEDPDRIAVTMGKQFTRQLSTRYSVESKDGKIVQRALAEYRIFQNLLIGAFQDTRGVYGTELRFIWENR